MQWHRLLYQSSREKRERTIDFVHNDAVLRDGVAFALLYVAALQRLLQLRVEHLFGARVARVHLDCWQADRLAAQFRGRRLPDAWRPAEKRRAILKSIAVA